MWFLLFFRIRTHQSATHPRGRPIVGTMPRRDSPANRRASPRRACCDPLFAQSALASPRKCQRCGPKWRASYCTGNEVPSLSTRIKRRYEKTPMLRSDGVTWKLSRERKGREMFPREVGQLLSSRDHRWNAHHPIQSKPPRKVVGSRFVGTDSRAFQGC